MAGLFTASVAALLTVTTLCSVCTLALAGHVSSLSLIPWLAVALSAVTAGLLLLPLTALIRSRFALQYHRLRPLLPIAAGEVTLLSSMLILAHPDIMVWQTLLWSIGAAAFSIIMVAVFAGLRLRLSVCDVPKACQGLPIELVTVGILALALLSPTGAFAG